MKDGRGERRREMENMHMAPWSARVWMPHAHHHPPTIETHVGNVAGDLALVVLVAAAELEPDGAAGGIERL